MENRKLKPQGGDNVRHPALQGKRDANEPEIIAALEAVGATVEQNPIGGGKPDLEVGFRGDNYKMEVKKIGGKLNKKQKIWHSEWRGQRVVVETPEDALRVLGIG